MGQFDQMVETSTIAAMIIRRRPIAREKTQLKITVSFAAVVGTQLALSKTQRHKQRRDRL